MSQENIREISRGDGTCTHKKQLPIVMPPILIDIDDIFR